MDGEDKTIATAVRVTDHKLDRPAGLVPVCETHELTPGSMKACNIDGLPPLAVFNLNGEFCVTSNVCTHEVALLTTGYFEDGIVECPMHGGSFDVRTGEPRSFPCKLPLKTFAVVIEDGKVFVRP